MSTYFLRPGFLGGLAWALLPLRVRRIERVKLHADLTILTRLAVSLDKARAERETHPLSVSAA